MATPQGPIISAGNILLSANTGTIPDMRETLTNYFQPMTFVKVAKAVSDFEVSETPTSITFRGVWQPNSKNLEMKPEGQRSWPSFTLYSEVGISLDTDEVIQYLGTQYRVLSLRDFSLYGYLEYHLVQDYSGAGP